MNNRKIILSAQNLTRVYQKGRQRLEVLKQISFDVNEGEILAIIGPSGAGKTTLLNLLTGVDHPTAGDVFFEDKNFTKFRENKKCHIRNQKMGLVFQFYHLFNDLTALENVLLPAKIRFHWNGKRIRDRAHALLDEVGLKERKSHFPSELSGGEMQRVAIARALMNDPKLILCDEPTGNLDSETGKGIMAFLRNMSNKYKKTIIIVTHDERIAGNADRVMKMVDGAWQKAYENIS
jgi:ABC-type lipoprotein export system ATPase subunit